MKLSLDAPTNVTMAGKSGSLLNMVHGFSDFDFISAERAYKDKEYAMFYKDSENIKFVDGTPRAGEAPISMEILKKVVDFVGGTFILNSYEENVKIFGERRAVGVLQGKTLKEIAESASLYQSVTVAVPASLFFRNDVPLELSGYMRALVVNALVAQRVVHLMGFLSLAEFYWYADRPNVQSLSTCVPVILGLKGEDILEPTSDVIALRCETESGVELTQKNWSALCRNVALLRKWMG